MTIENLKKETGLTQKEIAQFFGMTYGAFANSSAKKRYEDALCNFYTFVKKQGGWAKTLKTVEQHEPRLNEPEQACFISHVSKQSELLIAFYRHMKDVYEMDDDNELEPFVENWVKSNL